MTINEAKHRVAKVDGYDNFDLIKPEFELEYTKRAYQLIIDELNKSELKGGWISVSEELPKHSKNVFVSTNNKRVGFLFYNGSLGFHKINDEDTITHWMDAPLPPFNSCTEQWHELTVSMGNGYCSECGKNLNNERK